MKKICIITGTRAEYGLFKNLINKIRFSKKLKYQIIVTGMHLSPEFGDTYKDILSDGYKINSEVEMLLSSDTPSSIAKSIGLGVIGFSDAFKNLKPDLILIIGDRYEVFSATIAAMTARIPIAHIHGGEVTQGLIDEPIRHSITKMSHLHFVATKEYQKRVIQLGESPENVFLVGGLGVDVIKSTNLMSKKSIQKELALDLYKKNILITFHPVTLESNTASLHFQEILKSLQKLKDTNLIFTLPNADTEAKEIIKDLNNFSANKKNVKIFKSLGQLKYWSLIKLVDVVIGNSSSGLLEVPSFKKPTINIGDRQEGRIKAKSVIDCAPISKEISNSIEIAYSNEFRLKLKNLVNPYGSGGASDKIIKVLEKNNLNNIIKKNFFDVEFL